MPDPAGAGVLDQLDDDLLLSILRHVDNVGLSAVTGSCQRLLRLVRAQPRSFTLHRSSGLHLLQLPPTRTFTGTTSLVYNYWNIVENFNALTVAVRHASTYWDQLISVDIHFPDITSALSRLLMCPGVMGNVLHPLQSLRQLRQLSLPLFEADSMVYVGQLQQLTALTLLGHRATDTVNLSPLAQLTALKDLHVLRWVPEALRDAQQYTSHSEPSSSSHASDNSCCSCLPGSLIRLRLESCAPAPWNWWPHLAAAGSSLQRLEVVGTLEWTNGGWASHPSKMLQTVAPHLPQLQSLLVSVENHYHAYYDSVPNWSYGAPAALQGHPGLRFQQGRATQLLIVPAMLALSQLTQLECRGCACVLAPPEDLETLSSCSGLHLLGHVCMLDGDEARSLHLSEPETPAAVVARLQGAGEQ